MLSDFIAPLAKIEHEISLEKLEYLYSPPTQKGLTNFTHTNPCCAAQEAALDT